MGQRSQIIVKLPEYYLNKGNQNNRAEEWLVFHNQWLYGYSFLDTLRNILSGFNILLKDHKEGSLNRYVPDYKEFIEKSIKHDNYKEITNTRMTCRYWDKKENDNNLIANNCNNWEELFKFLDNNNGFIFINVSKKGVLSFDIVNGSENAEELKSRTSEEYLKLFYKEAEIKKDFPEAETLFKELEQYKQVSYKTIPFPERKQKEFVFNIRDIKVFADNEERARDEAEKELKERVIYLLTLKGEKNAPSNA